MSNAAQEKYIADFQTFSTEKKHRHLAVVVRFIIDLLAEKEGKPASPLDEGAVDAECSVS
jgi:hypothetical protein